MNRPYRYCFFGDSITEGVGSDKRYTSYLEEKSDAEFYNYGVNGAVTIDAMEQIHRMEEQLSGDYDCAVIFIGTNDFYASIALGEPFSEITADIPTGLDGDGNIIGYCRRKKRSFNLDTDTFTGRLNTILSYLREHYGEKRIVLVTPIHRGFAFFGGTNYQPEELYANFIGEYPEAYVEAVRRAADIWACELIDMYRSSGLFPMSKKNAQMYFHDVENDSLHPNAAGHKRIAEIMWAELSRFQPME